MTTTTEYDRAVAAVRKYLAECERRDRIGRRYKTPGPSPRAKLHDAELRVIIARIDAVAALAAVERSTVEIGGTRYAGAMVGLVAMIWEIPCSNPTTANSSGS